MKIIVKYENDNVSRAPIEMAIEVPDDQCLNMVEEDYRQRPESAEDKSSVTRRSPQEIMDDRFNKPLYNLWHRENRHRGQVQKPFRKYDEETDDTDGMDFVPDNSDEEDRSRRYDYEAVCQKIRSLLKTTYAEVLIAVEIDGMTLEEYARETGENRDAIYKRLQRSKKKISQLFLKKCPIFSFPKAMRSRRQGKPSPTVLWCTFSPHIPGI